MRNMNKDQVRLDKRVELALAALEKTSRICAEGKSVSAAAMEGRESRAAVVREELEKRGREWPR